MLNADAGCRCWLKMLGVGCRCWVQMDADVDYRCCLQMLGADVGTLALLGRFSSWGCTFEGKNQNSGLVGRLWCSPRPEGNSMVVLPSCHAQEGESKQRNDVPTVTFSAVLCVTSCLAVLCCLGFLSCCFHCPFCSCFHDSPVVYPHGRWGTLHLHSWLASLIPNI